MSEIIGFLMIEYAVVGFLIFTLGWEMEIKTKITTMFGFYIFLTLITVGCGMMTGWK